MKGLWQNKFKKDEEVNFKNITIPARYAEMARDLPKGKICEKQAKVQIYNETVKLQEHDKKIGKMAQVVH